MRGMLVLRGSVGRFSLLSPPPDAFSLPCIRLPDGDHPLALFLSVCSSFNAAPSRRPPRRLLPRLLLLLPVRRWRRHAKTSRCVSRGGPAQAATSPRGARRSPKVRSCVSACSFGLSPRPFSLLVYCVLTPTLLLSPPPSRVLPLVPNQYTRSRVPCPPHAPSPPSRTSATSSASPPPPPPLPLPATPRPTPTARPWTVAC